MNVRILAVLTAAIIYLPANMLHAAGTPAGTNITNSATANYTVGGAPVSSSSNTVTVRVVEILNLTLTWQDAGNIMALVGQGNAMLTFRLTNTGNGTERFSLANNTAVSGDNFDPAFVSIYLDSNGSGSYDAGTDTLYTAGTNDPTLAADGFINLFVFCDIPSSGVVNNDLGIDRLTASSLTGTGSAGTVLAGLGDGGVDAVIGSTGGSVTASGTYQVTLTAATVVINKSATVSNVYGNTEPIPGATIRYALTVTVTGAGTASGIVITDPVPANTTYTGGTLRLNSAVLSDGKDADAGDVGGTTAGTLTVTLGDMTSGTAAQTITFDVTIN